MSHLNTPRDWSGLPQSSSPETVGDAQQRQVLRAIDEKLEALIGRRGTGLRALQAMELVQLGVLERTKGGDLVRRKTATVTTTSAQVTTADATDLATAIALANDLKAKYNALQADVANLMTSLRDGGVLNR